MSQSITKLDAFTLPLGSLASSLLISCPSLQSSFNFSCTSHPCHHLRHPPHNLLVCSFSTFSLLQSRTAHYIHAQHYMHGVNSAAHYVLDIRSSLIFPALCSITTPFLLLFSFSISNTPALATHRAQYLESMLSSLNCHASTKPFPMKSLISVSLSSK